MGRLGIIGSDYTCPKRLFVDFDMPDAVSENRLRCIHFDRFGLGLLDLRLEKWK
jgi:hypothetical protein